MADSLKTFFSPALVRRLATDVTRAQPTFNSRAFIKQASAGLDDLELLDRGKHIARALAAHLPPSYPAAVKVLLRSLGPEHASEELVGVGMGPFFYLPHTLFVAEHGLDHFDVSMHAQYELTKRFSAESSIRPYIAKYPERTFAILREWTRDPNPHVRRLVSEGTRLRLPWASRVAWLDSNPEKVLELLELLKDDPATVVRRSVANNLNDLGKVRPELLTRTCATWLEDASPERRALVEHALRSAVKRGHGKRCNCSATGRRRPLRLRTYDSTHRALRSASACRSASRFAAQRKTAEPARRSGCPLRESERPDRPEGVQVEAGRTVSSREGRVWHRHFSEGPHYPQTPARYTHGGHHHQWRRYARRRIRGDTLNLRIAIFVVCLTATAAGWQQAMRPKPEAIGLSSASASRGL